MHLHERAAAGRHLHQHRRPSGTALVSLSGAPPPAATSNSAVARREGRKKKYITSVLLFAATDPLPISSQAPSLLHPRM
jgi:hypothetical protein